MAVTKRILVLANAIRHAPCRCIAGREVILAGAKYRFGPWIRPVSSHGEGELSPHETVLADGGQPQVFDFIEVALLEPRKESHQPENWTIDPQASWQNVSRRFRPPPMRALLETPPHLWRLDRDRSDRVASGRLLQSPPSQSLYFIRLDRLRVRFEWRQWENTHRLRRRAVFAYNGTRYDLSITDPAFHARHAARIPARGDPPLEFDLAGGRGYYACISLAHGFNGYHYKVAATILEA